MNWIYLSPHLDDAVYSCGGLIWQQTQAGEDVQIWTICAGDPPSGPLSPFAQSLHDRWGTERDAVWVRRKEDEQAVSRVGAAIRHLSLPDCIYRRGGSGEALYTSEEAIFGPVHPAEQPVIVWLSQLLAQQVPAETHIVCPLTLGGHVDHRLVRHAAERAGCIYAYYADFPYAARWDLKAEERVPLGWEQAIFPLSDAALQAWIEGAALYTSQFSSFWPDQIALQTEFQDYTQLHGGVRLWRLLSNQEPFRKL